MILGPLLRVGIPALWLAWAAYWLVVARDTKRARWRAPFGTRLLYTIPQALCYALLAAPRLFPPVLKTRMLPRGSLLPVLGAVLVAAGLGLAVWARRHLGREWSGLVTLKEGHRLIRTGPYRTVRHPIYSGLLLAVFGTALAIGQWRGVIAVVCNLIGLLRKMHVEETLMARNFPEYQEYRQRTAALMPGLY